MARQSKTFGTVLLDLFKAFLNATLMLLLACLIVGYMLVSKFDGIVATFAQSLVTLDPVTQQLQETRTEVAGLRSDLNEMISNNPGQGASSLMRLQTRVALMDDKLRSIEQGMQKLARDPYVLIDYGIESAARQATQSLETLRGCERPDANAPSG